MIFVMTADIKCTVEQSSQSFCENRIAYWLALIRSTSKLSLQFEL